MNDDYRIKSFTDLSENNYKTKNQKGLRWWSWLIIILFIGGSVSGGVYYLLWKKKNLEGISKLFKFSEESPEINNKLFPSELPDDIELQQAAQQFKDGYLKAAKANFYDILQSTKSNNVKSFASVYLGIISDEEGKFTLAIDFFKRALKFDDNNFHAYYNLSVSLKNSGRHADAIEALKKAEQLRPELMDAKILQGKLYYENNELNKAEEALKKATEQGRNPRAVYNLAKVYKKQGKITEAKAGFLDALNLAGAGEVAYKSANELGILYAKGGDADLPNAREYFKRAIVLAPYHPKYYYNLALIEYRLGNTKQALESLQKAGHHGRDTPQTFIYIARLYEELGRYSEAEEALKKGLDKSANDSQILSSLADNLIQQGKWESASSILKKILYTSTKTLEKSQALYSLGLVHSELKDWSKALDYLKRAKDLDPTNDDILIALGQVFVNRDEPHKAVAAFKEALRINPDNVKILKESARIYIQIGLLSEAEESLRRLIESDQKKPEDMGFTYYNLGKLNKLRKDFGTAIDYFQEAIKSEGGGYEYDSLLQVSDSILQAKKPPVMSYPYLQKAISLKPKEMEPRFLLSKALVAEDTIDSRSKAEDELINIIESSSVEPLLLSRAHTLRGVLYHKNGLYLRALDDFNRALELDPSNDDAFQNKRATASMIENQ